MRNCNVAVCNRRYSRTVLVPLPRLPRLPYTEAESRSAHVAVATRPMMVAIVEPDALLRPVLVDALRAQFDATVVQLDNPARLSHLTETFQPDLFVVDPQAIDAVSCLGEGAPVLFTDIPPAGSRIRADRYAVLARPFQLDDFLAAANRLSEMEPA